jgi:hypothetical protein
MRDPAPNPETTWDHLLLILSMQRIDGAQSGELREIDHALAMSTEPTINDLLLPYEEYKRAIVALVRSDAPLDPPFRRWLAGELDRLYFAAPAQRHKYERRVRGRSFAWLVKELHARMRGTGLTATDAEAKVADEIGMNLSTLRKRIYRARK